MKPPFTISVKMLSLTAQISNMIGRLQNAQFKIPLVDLRRQIDVSSIHASCVIEGNSLTLEQTTDILNGKSVVGPKKDIIEIKNAYELYEKINSFDPLEEKDLLEAHGILMKDLGINAGKYRKTGIGVASNQKVIYVAPPHTQVPALISDLFDFVRNNQELHPLILSSIFHYEFEFIHPFEDGNGRMGRFWQTLMLRHYNTSFHFVPIEIAIKANQQEYYQALRASNKEGNSNVFIEFILQCIQEAVLELEKLASGKSKPKDRMDFIKKYCPKVFTRKEYIKLIGHIEEYTASRDLKKAVDLGILELTGERAKAVYRKK